jgi:hypothetical protein
VLRERDIERETDRQIKISTNEVKWTRVNEETHGF